MEARSLISLLVEIQSFEQEIQTRRKHLEEIPKSLSLISHKKAEHEESLKSTINLLDQTQKQISELKTSISQNRERLHRSEIRLNEASIENQISALKREVDTLKKSLQQLEDRLQMVEYQQLELEEKRGHLSSSIEKTKEQFDLSSQSQEILIKKISTEIAELEKEKQRISAIINPIIFQKFQRILHSKSGIGVAAISKESCGACRMKLPPQLLSQVKRLDSLLQCPSCSRFIYWGGP